MKIKNTKYIILTSACTLTGKNVSLMSSSLHQAREMNCNNTVLSPPSSSSAMSPPLQEEHELQTAQEMAGDHATRTTSSGTNSDQANKNLRGNQRTSGMPVSVVYQVMENMYDMLLHISVCNLYF